MPRPPKGLKAYGKERPRATLVVDRALAREDSNRVYCLSPSRRKSQGALVYCKRDSHGRNLGGVAARLLTENSGSRPGHAVGRKGL